MVAIVALVPGAEARPIPAPGKLLSQTFQGLLRAPRHWELSCGHWRPYRPPVEKLRSCGLSQTGPSWLFSGLARGTLECISGTWRRGPQPLTQHPLPGIYAQPRSQGEGLSFCGRTMAAAGEVLYPTAALHPVFLGKGLGVALMPCPLWIGGWGESEDREAPQPLCQAQQATSQSWGMWPRLPVTLPSFSWEKFLLVYIFYQK